MTIIDVLKARVTTFKEELENGTLMEKLVKDNESWIVDMNTEDQLFERGVDRFGRSIMDYKPYKPTTIKIKSAKGQPTNRVTLRDEGDFHRSFKVQTYNDRFLIYADDWKSPMLAEKYGVQVVGLTDENAQSLARDYILPELRDIAKSQLTNLI